MPQYDRPADRVSGGPITLKARGVRVLSWRFCVARWVIAQASKLLPYQVQLVEDEPPATAHDVGVEKIGTDMMLRIGDRAVRLPKGDARHIGGMLEAGWCGTAYGMRAHGYPDRL